MHAARLQPKFLGCSAEARVELNRVSGFQGVVFTQHVVHGSAQL